MGKYDYLVNKTGTTTPTGGKYDYLIKSSSSTPTTSGIRDDSFLGIAKNTVLGLPKAALDVGKDIGRSVSRNIGSVGLTVAKPFGGVEELEPSQIKSPFGQEMYRNFFGDEPLKTVEDRIAQAELAIKKSPFALKTGLDKFALPLAFGGVFGTTALDLTPFGSLEKNATKALLKETTEVGARKILASLKVPDDIATKFAPEFASAKTPEAVQDAFDMLKGVIGVKTKADDVAQTGAEVAPRLTDDIARAKASGQSFDEWVKGQEEIGRARYKTASTKMREASDIGDGARFLEAQKEMTEANKLFRGKDTRSQLKAEWDGVTGEAAKVAQKLVPEIGKGASATAKADQALAKLPEQYQKEFSSLIDIVSQRQTEVKSKVNIIDYLRTPDRVLEKIGFVKESKLLREGYDRYVKELPKNIDKITEWSKQVPKESAKSIFKYLDGEKVDLSQGELKVAGEIKSWLAEWADRLKLPEDNRISNYITHIFDQELIAKEFDEELAKIITDRIPGSVYDPFVLKRLGKMGYKENVWEALDAYVKRATRKVNMDPALEAIQAKAGTTLDMSNIETSQFKYVQRYVSGVNMRPTELDNLLDNTIKNAVGYRYGQRPVTYLTKTLRQMTYRGMLGLNPGSALRNVSQGINTYAVLGEKYTAIGYAKLLSRNALREASEEGVFSPGFIQDRTLSSTKKAMQRIDKGLFAFFELAERINRGAAYFGAKSKALAQGKSPQEAIEFGKSVVRKTQFAFGSIDTPVAVQSDIVKTIAQFQNFTIKQTEFLAEMVKDKNFVGLLRYAVAGMVFVNTVGRAFGMRPEELIPSYRFGAPPSLKFPVETTKAILGTPDKYGRTRDLKKKIKDVGASTVGLIPGGTQAKKSLQGLGAFARGKDVTPTGRKRFDVPQDLEHFLQSVLFGKYSTKEGQEYIKNLK